MPYKELAEKLLENMILADKSKLLSVLSKIIHGEMFAIRVIAAHSDGITPGDISKAAGTSPARIAAELNNLESKGLITREIDFGNRRRILVRLTPDGEKTAEEYRFKAIQAAGELLNRLGEKDALEYVRIIGKLGEIQSKEESSM